MASYSIQTNFRKSGKDLINQLNKSSNQGVTIKPVGLYNSNNIDQTSYLEPGKNYSVMQIPENNSSNSNNRADLENAYLNSLRGGGGYASQIDLANILDSYAQSANAQKQTISDSSSSQRESLLNSLKRFQGETEEARSQQRRSFNASRADLEGQTFMANRRAAQSAAARGLGGSGLQQLAQLQNLINQGDATNRLAQSNTDALKAIATAAQNKEEDTNTALQNLDRETANKLAQIDANTANLQAQLQYNEAVRLEDAKARAAQAAASGNALVAQYQLNKLQQEDEQKALEDAANVTLANILAGGTNALNTAYSSNQKNTNKVTSKQAKKALDNANTLYAQMLLESANAAGVNANPYLNDFYSLYTDLYNKNKK